MRVIEYDQSHRKMAGLRRGEERGKELSPLEPGIDL